MVLPIIFIELKGLRTSKKLFILQHNRLFNEDLDLKIKDPSYAFPSLLKTFEKIKRMGVHLFLQNQKVTVEEKCIAQIIKLNLQLTFG